MESILILDEDAANLQGIADVLRSEDYSILEASTGLQAIETGKQYGPLSLLVSDIELPDFSGTEVALALYGLYPRLPILFMSGNAIGAWSSQNKTNLKRLTGSPIDFLQKPFSIKELAAKLRECLSPA